MITLLYHNSLRQKKQLGHSGIKFAVIALSILLILVSVTEVQLADALKSKGTKTKKFGSATDHIVCGIVLCSEIEETIDQQSRFSIGGIAQQGFSKKEVMDQYTIINIGHGTSVPGCEQTDSCYTPSVATIDVGSTVMWVNKDTAAHTVTSGTSTSLDELFDSGLFMTKRTFLHRFNEAGSYPYFCMVHPWMMGKIIVSQSEEPQSTSNSLDNVSPEESLSVVIPEGTSVPGCEDDLSCYSPVHVILPVGATLTWMNQDSAAHTVTSGTVSDSSTHGQLFDSALFPAGTTFEHTFNELGSWDYFCMVHPWMTGRVSTYEPTPPPAPEPNPLDSISPEESLSVVIPEGTSVLGCEQDLSCYNPVHVILPVGATLTWMNQDSAAHTVTSGAPEGGPDQIFDSSMITAGGTFEHTFNELGSWDYFCMMHPWATGRVSTYGEESVPSADIIIPQGTSVPGCEESDACYLPYTFNANVGQTVIWSNEDSVAHTVTSGTPEGGPDQIFDSSLFQAGTTFEHTFNELGSWDYFCMVHPWMKGIVLVE